MGEKRFSIRWTEFLHLAMWHDHDIDFARWLHPAMWHVALESWRWIHQVAAHCNVIPGSGMTCHWLHANVCHIAILHLFSISITSPQSTCHPAPVFEILSKSDWQKKWRHVDFQAGRSQPSWILKGHVRLPYVNRHHSYKLLSFWEKPVSAFWRQDPRLRISAILDFRGPVMGLWKAHVRLPIRRQ